MRLYLEGEDLRALPLIERRLTERPRGREQGRKWSKSESTSRGRARAGEGAGGKGLEGLIGKRADAPYSSTRSTAWIKLKCKTKRQEFIVTGFTTERRAHRFGSMCSPFKRCEGRLQ